LSHQDADFENNGPEPNCVPEALNVEFAILILETKKVQGR
jgi:hypothetical protein